MNKNNFISLCAVVLAASLSTLVSASEVQGFLEPYRQVSVPARDIGVIQELLVEEGEQVTKGQVIAQMESDVLRASLEVARAAKEAKGALRAAEVALSNSEQTLAGYKALRSNGNATKREIDRAESERLQLEAKLQGVREELEIRRLEYKKTQAQLENRRIKAPFNGFVLMTVKDAGEFVAPTDPVIMEIVELEMLKIVFSVPLENIAKLRKGNQVFVLIGKNKKRVEGFIDFVSPTTNAKSGTVKVKVRVPNPNMTIQSGESCTWDLWSAQAKQQQAKTPTLDLR